MSDADTERGPNGFRYIDSERSQVVQWENGEYRLRIATEGGRTKNVNLRPEQMGALVEAVNEVFEADE